MVLFNPKTRTLYKRDDNFKVNGIPTDERFMLVKNWIVTEKVDGMSTIVTPDGYYGRSANTNFNVEQEIFLASLRDKVIASDFAEEDIAFYGELVGPRVQGNPHNFDDLHFVVFDIRMNNFWLDWHNVRDIAGQVGFMTVPYLAVMTTDEIVDFVKTPLIDAYFEGIVAKTDPYLYDNQGNRLMFKLKKTDF